MSSTKAKEFLDKLSEHEEDPSENEEEDDEEKGEHSSSTGTSTNGTSTKNNSSSGGDDVKNLENIIKNEEKAVFKSKVLVAIAILCCAVSVTVAVYLLTKRNDLNSFETEYKGMVNDIRALVRWEVRYNFALMEQLSASTSIAASYLNSTFPFHTEPGYEITGGFVDGMGGIMSAAFAPLVRLDQIDEWADYTVKNQGWIEQSKNLQKVHQVHRDALHGTIQDHEHDRKRRQLQEDGPSEQISPLISRWVNGQKAADEAREMYAPIWQISPANYETINLNLLSDPRIADLYEVMLTLDELCDVIEFPAFNADAAKQAQKCTKVQVSQLIREQLRAYASDLAASHRNNHFHSFEHASHVTMSVSKLLTRIVAPEAEGQNGGDSAALHDHTYGITSDPLTHFTVHDVDHQGVTNAQLVQEETDIASHYRGKSVAEQNSIDIAWKLLMKDCYKDLRNAIYCNEDQLYRFRQLMVNVVLATDIADKELKADRNERWTKAFSGDIVSSSTTTVTPKAKKEHIDRKATIVIEHIIQASDVAHTMQHWHIYQKWNKRLFMELYSAHKNGRMETNPESFWAKGEIGFFDFYIIPLAKKLGECGVFGVSGEEYMNYALKNWEEWESKGEMVVAQYMEEIKKEEEAAAAAAKEKTIQEMVGLEMSA